MNYTAQIKSINLFSILSNEEFTDWYSKTNITSAYTQHLIGADSYLHTLDKDGYLESFGMCFNHLLVLRTHPEGIALLIRT